MAEQGTELTASQSDSTPPSKYIQDYREVWELVEQEDFETAVEWARYNLTDSTLPRYWQVKNLLIMVAKTTDREKAEGWRMEAETIWTEAKDDAPAEDNFAQGWLRELRIDLDYLENTQKEAAKMWEDEDEDDEDEDESEEDEDEDDGDGDARGYEVEDENEDEDEGEKGECPGVGDGQMKEHRDLAPLPGGEQLEDADQVTAAG